MPDLPTLTVSQAHFERIVAAFPGATLAAKADAYRAWLINNLITQVESAEISRIEATLSTERETQISAVRASLPPRQNFPPVSDPA